MVDAAVQIAKVKRRAALGYYFWYALFLLLGGASIVLPGVAALGQEPAKVYAGLGALAAALFSFIRPNDYATGFDSAFQLAAQAETEHALGQIDEAAVSKTLSAAIQLMTFKYTGPPTQ